MPLTVHLAVKYFTSEKQETQIFATSQTPAVYGSAYKVGIDRATLVVEAVQF